MHRATAYEMRRGKARPSWMALAIMAPRSLNLHEQGMRNFKRSEKKISEGEPTQNLRRHRHRSAIRLEVEAATSSQRLMNVDNTVAGVSQKLNVLVVNDPHSCVGCKMHFKEREDQKKQESIDGFTVYRKEMKSKFKKHASPRANASATSQKNEFVTASPNPCSGTPSLLN